MDKVKVGDIVKAKFGSTVFCVQDSDGKRDHVAINPHGIVTRIKQNEQTGMNDIHVKLIFDKTSEAVYKDGDLDVIYSTNLTSSEPLPDTAELWGVTFKYDFGNGRASRTVAISECSLFDTKEQANKWIDNHKNGNYDTAFPAGICSEPKAVLIDRWPVK